MNKIAAAMVLTGLTAALAGCETPSSGGLRGLLNRGPVQAATNICASLSTEVYFETGATTLSTDARRALGLTVSQIRDCAIVSVTIIGLADATGAPSANQALSAQRAASVRQALEANGVSPTVIGLRAAGSEGAVTGTGEINPLRRQAQIEFRLAPR